jgi:hypothetical protein
VLSPRSMSFDLQTGQTCGLGKRSAIHGTNDAFKSASASDWQHTRLSDRPDVRASVAAQVEYVIGTNHDRVLFARTERT